MLDEIVEAKRREVATRQRKRPMPTLWSGLERSDRSLYEALRAPRTGFILECKKASPSQGTIRHDFDPAAIARAYDGVADAISVLTDAPYFQGALEYLGVVRAQTRAPVLCKDFVVDPYQIVEARAHGADAVLLMLSVLDDGEWRRCFEVAGELGLDCLTEVHDAAELERALELGAPILGINNRDLSTLEVDLGTTPRLAGQIPADRVVVCESGVGAHEDVRRLRAHADAFLVGTALMRAGDVSAAARRLVYGRFKVCGLTRPQDARAAWACGATMGGVILAEESPRRVSLDRARELVREAAGLDWVGVFVNQPWGKVAQTARQLGLSAVQLHGEEDLAYCASLREALPGGCAIWRAWRVRPGEPIPEAGDLGADRVLLDAHVEGTRGGTGQTFDWGALQGHPARQEVVLGGGLKPENIEQARALGTWGLDVNSGVEVAPGIKSRRALERLSGALRGLGRSGRAAEQERTHAKQEE